MTANDGKMTALRRTSTVATAAGFRHKAVARQLTTATTGSTQITTTTTTNNSINIINKQPWFTV
jgi:hypothetical protein